MNPAMKYIYMEEWVCDNDGDKNGRGETCDWQCRELGGGAILAAMFAKQHYYSLKADEHCSLKNQPAAALVRAVS